MEPSLLTFSTPSFATSFKSATYRDYMLHGSPIKKNPSFAAQQLFALREDEGGGEGEHDTSTRGSVTLKEGSGRGGNGDERDTSRGISGGVPPDGLPLTVDSDGSPATVEHGKPHRYSLSLLALLVPKLHRYSVYLLYLFY